MISDDNTSVHNRVISAFFDTDATATKTIDDLVAAGIPRQHISQTGGQAADTLTATDHDSGKGFWDSLKDMFLPDEDRYSYAEGLRRGGYLVSVTTDEANYTRVLEILDHDGSVDMEAREGEWRREGWSGYAGRDAGSAGMSSSAEVNSFGSVPTDITADESYRTDTSARAAAMGVASTGAVATSAATPATAMEANPARAVAPQGAGSSVATGQDEVISLYEEQLRVGKRDVNHGRVRLRSYVVETPVTEQVNLRNENVIVDRKSVDRPVTATDAMFQDRTIEAEEHVEEAVISKDARVTEEITLRKTAEDRMQTVTDTVRHTEVEVADGRTGEATGASRFSAATDKARIVEHMDVIAADGQKVGTVDHLDGPDMIKLAKTTSPDGLHHLVPLAWIDHVDQHVHLTKSASDVKAGW